MPALTSLPLLPTAVFGLAHVAGQVANASNGAKAGSVKKSDSPDQTTDVAKLVGVFAAYLAAAAAHAPTTPIGPSTPTPNTSLNGSAKSVNNVSVSLSSPSIMKSAGQTATVTKASALPSAAVPADFSSTKAGQAAAVVHAAATGTVPTRTNPPPSPPTRLAATAAKTPTTAEESVPSGIVPTNRQQTTENPILTLHDVPGPIKQDTPEAPVPSAASSTGRTESPGGHANTSVADVKPSSPVEATLPPEGQRIILAAQTQMSAPAMPHDVPNALRDTGALAHGGDDDSRQQTASPPLTLPYVTGVGTVSSPLGSTTVARPSGMPTDVPVTEQLARAFVTQADVVNRDGRTDFHLHLEPPQLGSVQIHLSATDHTISARVVVAQEGTRQLIEGQATQLRQSLADAGMVLGKFDVTHGGGGSTDGGYRQPPEPPLPLPLPSTGSRSEPTTLVKTSRTVPTDGIDILA